jgi:hypothetical protein
VTQTARAHNVRKVLQARLAVLEIKIRASKDGIRKEELTREAAQVQQQLDAAADPARPR